MKWFKKIPQRLEVEVELIRKYYPGARVFLERSKLTVFFKFRKRNGYYLAKLVYPDDFPWQQPKVWIIDPTIKKSPHQWRDKSLCIHGENDDSQISGKIVLDRAGQWIKAYETWHDTGRWPEL